LKRRGKTVLLVTHALHFLHQVDYIYNVVDGVIVEQGTYDTLVANGAAFARLLQEFSGSQTRGSDEADEGMVTIEGKKAPKRRASTLQEVRQKLDMKNLGKAAGTGKIEGRLMKAEKRTVGSIDANSE
jgi:ATP-binding cassette subfamily C (CFTR/MRP) protein 1